ncbi:hypothetical protein BFX06_13195 [Sulfobacillus thermosulfidooxidans]|uniref:Uncharacterized protein n=1 Tax=Sulfobacillus thermosulfidooxidans TaxID=28034 RepID=A0A1R0IUX1_SULTH|nr:hypothetical protein BFX05_10070 [Sulfobacillus thermosulfidooxidans]OLZ17557.1 hypothetical protein BFX06_13195 [Sulfobacillus thermosulfidooxidans]OLZ20879.1 hypothetical protein BFX07_14170 [Sulfobacillus thermosulfidooxidans]PSR24569.1 MAG: hypothetical protein C7B47_14480 [Sulfobacillus thermosulfidooxidans]
MVRSSINVDTWNLMKPSPPCLLTGYCAWTILIDREGITFIPILVSAVYLQTAMIFPKLAQFGGRDTAVVFAHQSLQPRHVVGVCLAGFDNYADYGQTFNH